MKDLKRECPKNETKRQRKKNWPPHIEEIQRQQQTATTPANGYVITTKVLTAAFSIDSVLVPNSGHHVFYIAFELTTFYFELALVSLPFVFYSFIVNYRKAIYSFSGRIFFFFLAPSSSSSCSVCSFDFRLAWCRFSLYGYLPKCS